MNDMILRPDAHLEATERVAEHFLKCGFFRDVKDASQALVKILAGQELGFGPMAAMQGIHIIQGKPEMSANLLATCVKRHPQYDYRIKRLTDTGCQLAFYQRHPVTGEMEFSGDSTFTTEDAAKAGLMGNPTWRKFPRNMLFARALSNGVRFHCPDATAFASYTEGEIGGPIEEPSEDLPPVEIVDTETGEVRPATKEDDGFPEGDSMDEWQKSLEQPLTKPQRKKIMAMCREMDIDDDGRRKAFKAHVGKDSLNDLTVEDAKIIIDRLEHRMADLRAAAES